MAVRPVSFTPRSQSFKGLIYSPEDNVAVNTKYITSMKAAEVLDKDVTDVYLTNSTHVVFNASLEQMLATYNRAAASEVYTIKVFDKQNDEKSEKGRTKKSSGISI